MHNACAKAPDRPHKALARPRVGNHCRGPNGGWLGPSQKASREGNSRPDRELAIAFFC